MKIWNIRAEKGEFKVFVGGDSVNSLLKMQESDAIIFQVSIVTKNNDWDFQEVKSMTLIPMEKDKIKKNLNFVIYNYLAAEEKITAGKMVEDFKLKYDIILSLQEVNRILGEYVVAGVLSQRFRYFYFVSRQYFGKGGLRLASLLCIL